MTRYRDAGRIEIDNIAMLSVISSHPINKIDELLPWNMQKTFNQVIDTQEAA
ncbi:MAG: hypothetical protein M3H12_16915 [Chromatiales bacterium]|nr:hypothetical protein [Gammaproteobacteria bacterium]